MANKKKELESPDGRKVEPLEQSKRSKSAEANKTTASLFKIDWPEGHKYEGEQVNGNREGYGTQTWAQGHSFEGQFVNDKRQGPGKLFGADGSEYTGAWN